VKKSIISLLVLLLVFFVLSSFFVVNAAETVKIGILFPFTGPMALNGNDQFNGVEIAREMQNEKGGLWGKKIEFAKGDAVNANAARSEAERLISVEGVKLIIGTFSSSCSYTASAVAEKSRVIYWEVNAIADKLTQRGFKYYFRTNVKGSDYGIAAVPFIKEVVAPKLGKDPKDLQIATLFEDTLYGTITASEFAKHAVESHLNVVGSISYNAAKALDFSSILMKLKVLKPDVLFAVPYVKDMILFWRQAKELNFNVPVFIGGGCVGESGVAEGLGDDVNYIFNAYLPTFCNPNALNPESRAGLKEFEERYEKKHEVTLPPILAVTGFASTEMLFGKVLPVAGSLDPDAVREAALKTNIPDGGTCLGFGLKFAPPGHPMAGHNLAAFAIIQQYQGGRLYVVWPEKYALKKPLLPMPTWEERKKGITHFVE